MLARDRRAPWLQRAVLVALVMTSCRPRAGGSCTRGQASCTGASEALFCGANESYEIVRCRGSDGCAQIGARVTCDQSVAELGERCTRPGSACTPDGHSALACVDSAFLLAERCEGPFHCRHVPYDGFAPGGSGNILCDNDVASPGDPCLEEGDVACTPDGTATLRCAAKKMVLEKDCKGPGGCKVTHPSSRKVELVCDTDAR